MSTISDRSGDDRESPASSCDSLPNSDSECDGDLPAQLSPRLIEALSPSGGLYDVLWPIIIDCATHEQRNDCLCYVNRFFATRVEHVVSEVAKRRYFRSESDEFSYPKPVHLDLEALAGVQWASWGADSLEFKRTKNFRKFCAVGDVDPDKGAFQFNNRLRIPNLPPGDLALNLPPIFAWVFISRTRDVIFETSTHNPNLESWFPCAYYFGITGRADKVRRMYEFVMESKEIRASEIFWGFRPMI